MTPEAPSTTRSATCCRDAVFGAVAVSVLHSTALSRHGSHEHAIVQHATYHNLIDGAWVPSRSGGHVFENRNPARAAEVVGLFQQSTRGGRSTRPSTRPRAAYRTWRLVPAPRRAELLFRAAQLIAERKDALARDMTREMGKILDETRRRCAGSDRHDVLHGGRRPPPVRADRSVRAARQVRDVRPAAPGRLRPDHAVELPDGDSRRGKSPRRWSAATRSC